MLQQAANKVTSQVREGTVTGFVIEQGLALFPKRKMSMHSRTVIACHGFGHKGGGNSEFLRSVFNQVLELHHVVTRRHQRVKTIVDLVLPPGANLVVSALHFEPGVAEQLHHVIAQVTEFIGRGHREVAALERGLIGEVSALFLPTGIPIPFNRIQFHESVIRLGLVTHRIK